MIRWFCYAVILLFVNSAEARGDNGGIGCAACTIVLGLTEQLAEIYNETLFAASLRFCHFMPYPVDDYCRAVVQKLEPVLVNRNLTKLFTPDVICYGLGMCYITSESGYCHLFPRPKNHFHRTVERAKKLLLSHDCNNCWQKELSQLTYNWCTLPGIRKICETFIEGWVEMAPALDADNDMFSIIQTARGSHWRGRDCRDWDRATYPGREPSDGDSLSDSNCNGIWGVDRTDGRSWEEKLCGASDSRGLIVLGDSVSAHFHFPEVWMDPVLMSSRIFQNVSAHLLDELDWPHLGFMTGYENTSEPFLIQGSTDSLYWRLRARNRCNHRDYQNVCRNGASSADIMSYVENVARNPRSDKPAVVMYAAVGNDVCNSYRKTIQNMTSPEKFKSNVVYVLEKLNNMLPNGSHVLLLGLVDGGFIFPTMADRFHPLGRLRHDVRYRDVYDWFTCMEIGPCVGWMSPNATLRQYTSQRAKELNEVLKNISEEYRFNAFELHYLDNPLRQIVHDWEMKGKHLWQLIEPVDSLHPAQVAQSLIADVLWQDITTKFPELLGDENKYNSEIQRMFGDQGGH